MKAVGLKKGDRFRVVEACDPAETADEYEVLVVAPGEHVVTLRVKRIRDGAIALTNIGKWVEVEVLQ